MRVFFMHIPKTAGTSFRSIIEKNYDYCNIFPDNCTIHRNGGLYPHPMQFLPSFNEFPNNKNKIYLLRGHYHHCLAGVFFEGPYEAITMVRNPVDRYISHVKHYIIHSKKRDGHILDTENIMHYIEECIYNDKYRHMNDIQVKFFRGDFSYNDLVSSEYLGLDVPYQQIPVCEEDLEKSIKRACEFSFVGIAENFDRSIKLLCEKMGWKIPNNIPFFNESHIKNMVISDKMIRLVEDKVKYDLKFYDKMVKLFENISWI